MAIAPNPDPVRQVIHQFALEHSKIFKRASKRRTQQWLVVYKRTILTKRDYEDADIESLIEKVEAEWQRFLAEEWPLIRDTLAKISWPKPPELTSPGKE